MLDLSFDFDHRRRVIDAITGDMHVEPANLAVFHFSDSIGAPRPSIEYPQDLNIQPTRRTKDDLVRTNITVHLVLRESQFENQQYQENSCSSADKCHNP